MKQHSLNNGFSQAELPQHVVGPFSSRSNIVCGTNGSSWSSSKWRTSASSTRSSALCRTRNDCSSNDIGLRQVQFSNLVIVRGRLRTHCGSLVTNTCGSPVWLSWLSIIFEIFFFLLKKDKIRFSLIAFMFGLFKMKQNKIKQLKKNNFFSWDTHKSTLSGDEKCSIGGMNASYANG